MPDNFAPKDPRNPYADYTPELLYAFLGKAKLARKPGEKYEYSNLGMGLLGHALTIRSGKSYEELLVERIAGPLGMGDTRIAFTAGMKKRLAPGHDAAGSRSPNWDIRTLAGAGAIRSTTRDMLRFLRACLAPPATDLGKAITMAAEVRHGPEGAHLHVGLGWHVNPTSGVRWHNGQTGGYHAMAAFDRKRGRAVVVLTNTATGVVDTLANLVMRHLRGEKVEPPKFRAAVEIELKIIDEYVGKYEVIPEFVLTVTKEENRLMVQATGQPKLRVFPASESKFFYREVVAEITFERDERGKVVAMTIHQGGRDVRAKKVE
jgi:CubicO group peptidase (beta-lactamase class C family)